MCGIFGYVGKKDVAPILIDGLRTLEYRGYDSAGIFIPGIGCYKSVGDIDALVSVVPEDVHGTSGIAHTRWATHGAPTETNAHPHTDASEKIYLVHNGIIENARELKEYLQSREIRCTSETDSEVLAKLIGASYEGDLKRAVKTALSMTRGAYGIAVMHENHPEEIVVARLGSPIVIGIGDGFHIVASDTSALLAHTKRVLYLEDGDVAVVTPIGYSLERDEVAADATEEQIDWDIADVQKGGYAHFMQKEIMEGPQVVRDTLRGRLRDGEVKLGGVESVLPELAHIDRMHITACGSAYLAGAVGGYLFEEYAKLPVRMALASEYRYEAHPSVGNEALLAISQSGETADTRAAVQRAHERSLLTLGVINVVGSTIARETDAGVYNHAGPEIAVASTKAFLSELVVMSLLTVVLGRARGMSEELGAEIVRGLEMLPEHIEEVLTCNETIKALATRYAHFEHMMFLGRNRHAPIAYEGALKLKEVSYIHAEAYPAGELKHGPIALLDEQFPVVALAPKDHTYEKMVSNIEEVKARRTPVIAVSTPGTEELSHIADDVITVPHVHPALQPILSVIPLHLFAYHTGVARGHNVDRPRNLAKSVTVE